MVIWIFEEYKQFLHWERLIVCISTGTIRRIAVIERMNKLGIAILCIVHILCLFTEERGYLNLRTLNRKG